MNPHRAQLILRYERGMDRELVRGALCLTLPPRYAELRELGLTSGHPPRKAVLGPLLRQWGVQHPPPRGWRTTLILRRLRIDNMVARRRLTNETQ